MKVLVTKSFLPKDLEYIRTRLLKGIELIIPPTYDEGAIIELALDADVFLGAYVSENLLSVAKNLSFIQIPWTGVDTLDFKLLQKYNVIVCNSHSNAAVVAEHALALMFDAAKKISYHDRLLRSGKWNRIVQNEINEISPFSIKVSHSKIAIIGFGAIGRRIYHMLRGFDCTFKAVTKDYIIEEELVSLSVYSPLEIDRALLDTDYVFVTVPLTSETRGLVNRKFLESMGERSVLINISRGEVMNEEDLFLALKNQTIAFAAIDTWFNYPTKNNREVFPSKRFDFHELNNLVLSPHRAGYIDSGIPHLDDAVENLNRFYQSTSLNNIVSLTKEY